MRLRIVIRTASLAAGALLLVGVQGPGAAGFAPNPGFEADCSGIPCGWSPAGATILREGGAHSGNATVRVTPAAPDTIGSASTCVNGVVPGSYTASAWYRTGAVGNAEVLVSFYAGSGCTSFTGTLLNAHETTTADSVWHRLEATSAAPAGTQSALIEAAFVCNACTSPVNYDDVALLSNRASNPGFESDCSGLPCDWQASAATIARVTGGAHAGNAKVSVTPPGANTLGGAFTCVNLSPGSYTASAWYNTAAVGTAEVLVAFYSGANCSTFTGNFKALATTTGDSAWHRMETAGTVPAGSQSVAFEVAFACTGCTSPATFDDASLVSSFAPNPGFEADCGGIPCNWSAANSTIARVTGGQHGGNASVRITPTAPSTAGSAFACVNGVTPGSYAASGWYKTAALGTAEMLVSFYSGIGCTTYNGSVIVPFAVTTGDSLWHRIEAAAAAPAGTQSAAIEVTFVCSGCTTSADFDDVTLSGGGTGIPTSIALATVAANRGQAGVVVTWRTASEVETLGFELWRAGPSGAWHRLNHRLIVATRGSSGSVYRFVDTTARSVSAYRYRVRLVSTDGSSRLGGEARVNRR